MPNLQRFQGLWGNSRDVEMYIFYWWKLDGVSVLSLYETLDKACVRGVGYRQRVFLIGGECLLVCTCTFLLHLPGGSGSSGTPLPTSDIITYAK